MIWGRFKNGLSDVILSLAGSIGGICLISLYEAMKDDSLSFRVVFSSYFDGGQLGLAVLGVTGVVYGASSRIPGISDLFTVLTSLILIAIVALTALIIGDNPGFVPGKLTDVQLQWLWGLFIGVHVMWLYFIVRKPPRIPSAQQASEEESKRVIGVKERAAERV